MPEGDAPLAALSAEHSAFVSSRLVSCGFRRLYDTVVRVTVVVWQDGRGKGGRGCCVFVRGWL